MGILFIVGIDMLQYHFIQQLKLLAYVERIILFGSRARGDNAPRADIDIAIDCPSASDAQWLTILNIIENADTLLKIDCVRFDTLSDSNIKKNIGKEGILLWKK